MRIVKVIAWVLIVLYTLYGVYLAIRYPTYYTPAMRWFDSIAYILGSSVLALCAMTMMLIIISTGVQILTTIGKWLTTFK